MNYSSAVQSDFAETLCSNKRALQLLRYAQTWKADCKAQKRHKHGYRYHKYVFPSIDESSILNDFRIFERKELTKLYLSYNGRITLSKFEQMATDLKLFEFFQIKNQTGFAKTIWVQFMKERLRCGRIKLYLDEEGLSELLLFTVSSVFEGEPKKHWFRLCSFVQTYFKKPSQHS